MDRPSIGQTELERALRDLQRQVSQLEHGYDTDWQTPTFVNSWVAFDAARLPQYRRLNGIVYHRGLVKNGTVAATMYTLPVKFRPDARDAQNSRHFQVVANGAAAFIYINGSTGAVRFDSGSNVWVDLAGITPYIAES
jgi:hypothetical protein